MTEKKLKNMEKDAWILMTWAIGFVFLILAALISGWSEIPLSLLAGMALTLMFMSVLLRAVRKMLKKREARNTGSSLALIETT